MIYDKIVSDEKYPIKPGPDNTSLACSLHYVCEYVVDQFYSNRPLGKCLVFVYQSPGDSVCWNLGMDFTN